MEPGHEDREYLQVVAVQHRNDLASMEPGHEDREYYYMRPNAFLMIGTPQWSPVMKTGNTSSEAVGRGHNKTASMEPGHEDREYLSEGVTQ